MHNLKWGARALASATLLAAMARLSSAETVLNLTGATTTYTQTASTGGTFIVSTDATKGAGTGNLNSFLVIQDNGAERGYNTGSGTPLDDKSQTTGLQLNTVSVVNVGGVAYRQFLLDVNQISSGKDSTNGNISLNQVQIFTSTNPIGGTTSAYSISEASTSPAQN